jgi:hypothetical protein
VPAQQRHHDVDGRRRVVGRRHAGGHDVDVAVRQRTRHDGVEPGLRRFGVAQPHAPFGIDDKDLRRADGLTEIRQPLAKCRLVLRLVLLEHAQVHVGQQAAGADELRMRPALAQPLFDLVGAQRRHRLDARAFQVAQLAVAAHQRRGGQRQDDQRREDQRPPRLHRCRRLAPGRRSAEQAPDQAIQQHRGHTHEGPALEQADLRHQLRIADQQAQQPIGPQDPQRGEQRIDHHHAHHARGRCAVAPRGLGVRCRVRHGVLGCAAAHAGHSRRPFTAANLACTAASLSR